ncbi:AAA family ATPase [Curtobacterium sp. TC1]|uniref:AAA family ATPase n=1 Tax=Curtobacterium sp. TC1 TaxID=2862880 RepID=UPI001C9A4A6B|nr:AAA family ATPase [Curtobacterium sp. TC1]QZQ53803.1 AAA family ATPase [Curtobacterium sp. TC1]
MLANVAEDKGEEVFTRFNHIGDYRIYQRWSMGSSASPFGRVNLVFGTNGSGKSTLASLMQECVDETLLPSADVRFDWQEGSLATEQVTSPGHDAWRRVHVFNRDYVLRSLRFEGGDGPRPDALLTIGEANVRAREELAEKRARATEITARRAELRAQSTAASKRRDDLMRSAAKTVVANLGHVGDRFRATNAYTITQVRNTLRQDRSVLEGASADLAEDLVVAKAAPMVSSTHVTRPDLVNEADLESIDSVLSESVTDRAIDALAGNGERAEWVQAGLQLHKDLDRCLFCDGSITTTRREELDAHFGAALLHLQRRVDILIRRMEDSSTNAERHLTALPLSRDLYTEVVVDFDKAKEAYSNALAVYQASIQALLDALQMKRSNPFDTPRRPADLRLVPPSTADIDAILSRHDARSQTHAKSVADAARRVELRYIADIASEVDRSEAEVTRADDEWTELGREKVKTDNRILALADLEADPIPLADELNRSLTRLLGRDELSITTGPDRVTYRLERNGSPATALSEGERTCIALIHFLARLRSSAVVDTKPIVFIDDPVSSLDHNVMFGVSSHLWAELVPRTSIAQVFVFTHSFEMFRQWVIQLQTGRRHVPGSATVHELHIRNVEANGSVQRTPTFVKWPHTDSSKAATLRSQYHYLFSQVGRALEAAVNGGTLAEQLDALALAPNAARRMLEAFLAFRYPQHVGSFDAALRVAIDALELGPARTRVVRYLHAYSHNEEPDIGRPLQPSEAVPVIQAVFELMRILDADHYTSMCAVLELDDALLTGDAGALSA